MKPWLRRISPWFGDPSTLIGKRGFFDCVIAYEGQSCCASMKYLDGGGILLVSGGI
jgi:hypothetical protein